MLRLVEGLALADRLATGPLPIKVLPASVAADAERLVRFQREAEILAALNHPNIAHILGLEKSNETFALVIELVEGPTLADRIALGAIPLDEALPIAKQIAEALEAAHEQGIVHRDLKPANIKVRADGTVKVLDFGLAKAMVAAGAAAGDATMMSPAGSEAGVLLGTAAYMSPEQARGRGRRSPCGHLGVWRRAIRNAHRPSAVQGRDRERSGRRALDFYQQALARDPEFALAYAGIAAVHIFMADAYVAPIEAYPKAKAAAEAALQHDSQLADAHGAKGFAVFSTDWDWTAADRDFARALELNSNSVNSLLFRGTYLYFTGRPDQGQVDLDRAARLDPLSPLGPFF